MVPFEARLEYRRKPDRCTALLAEGLAGANFEAGNRLACSEEGRMRDRLGPGCVNSCGLGQGVGFLF